MSSDINFTPGPWEVLNSTDVFAGLGSPNREGIQTSICDGWHIADCDGISHYGRDMNEVSLSLKERVANARLIAQAPRMYSALEALSKGEGLPPGETIESVLLAVRGDN